MQTYLTFALVLTLFSVSCTAQPTATPAILTASPTAAASTASPSATSAAYPADQVIAPTSAEQPASGTGYPAQSEGTITFKIVPGESQVTYQVTETFLNQNNKMNVAVGVTKQVTGDIFANKTNPAKSTLGTITVDISQFTSDSSRRDDAIRGRWLESSKYPQVIFVPKSVEALPASYVDGQEYSFKVMGDVSVHNVTQPVTFDVKAKLTGDLLTGTAETTIKMSDFGIGPITIGGILNTEDAVKITLTFVARPG